MTKKIKALFVHQIVIYNILRTWSRGNGFAPLVILTIEAKPAPPPPHPLFMFSKYLKKHYLVQKTCLFFFGYIAYKSVKGGGIDTTQADILKADILLPIIIIGIIIS